MRSPPKADTTPTNVKGTQFDEGNIVAASPPPPRRGLGGSRAVPASDQRPPRVPRPSIPERDRLPPHEKRVLGGNDPNAHPSRGLHAPQTGERCRARCGRLASECNANGGCDRARVAADTRRIGRRGAWGAAALGRRARAEMGTHRGGRLGRGTRIPAGVVATASPRAPDPRRPRVRQPVPHGRAVWPHKRGLRCADALAANKPVISFSTLLHHRLPSTIQAELAPGGTV
jgi:hypothetical protein